MKVRATPASSSMTELTGDNGHTLARAVPARLGIHILKQPALRWIFGCVSNVHRAWR